jgi:IclR family acetate operon transcriptional repressor
MPNLRRLRDATGETVNLAILRGTSLVYLEILESPAAFRMADVPGAIVPVHATALGQSIAIHVDPQRLAELLGPEPYERLTKHTPTTWREFNVNLDSSRSRGYGVDLEEAAIGVACVGAAILEGDRVIGAVSVSAPRARMSDERIDEVGELLVKATGDISARLGLEPDSKSGLPRRRD